MGSEAEATATLGEDRSEWPEVVIVVLHWNSYEDTAKCLLAIYDYFRIENQTPKLI